MKAMKIARFFGIPSTRVQGIFPNEIPQDSGSVDRLFSICTFHEVEDIDKMLEEMDRIVTQQGIVAVVERMCAIEESQDHIRNLKAMPDLLPCWFSDHGYRAQETRFQASYWGESLSSQPLFNFYMLSAKKG